MVSVIDLKSLVVDFDVISFDIFGTLLLRKCGDPRQVFKLIEGGGLPGFAKRRVRAEHRAYAIARRRGEEECTLADIYREMGCYRECQNRELEKEDEVLIPNPEILAAYNHAKALDKRIVIVSDMYLPRTFVLRMLEKNGIHGFDALYLSSDRKVLKATGKLFKQVLRDLAVSPERVLHIGDNALSDVEMANRNGIVAFHYVLDRADSHQPVWERKPFEFCRQLAQCRAGGGSIEYWEHLGYFLGGPVSYMYVRWVGLRAQAKGLTRLLFVGRDGYVLCQLSRIMFPAIQANYIYAPRTVALLVFDEFSADFSRDERQNKLIAIFADHDSPLVEDEIVALRNGHGLSDVRKSQLQGFVDAEWAEYAAYIKTLEIVPSTTGLVDGISSYFSAQRLVERAIADKIQTFYLAVCVDRKLAHDAEILYYAPNDSLRFGHLLEFLWSAPTPPILGIRKGQPVFDCNCGWYEKFKVSVYPDICRGILKAGEILMGAHVEVSPADWIEYCYDFLTNLRGDDMSCFSLVRNGIDFAHSVFRMAGISRVNRHIRFCGRTVLLCETRYTEGVREIVIRLLGRITLLSIVIHAVIRQEEPMRRYDYRLLGLLPVYRHWRTF